MKGTNSADRILSVLNLFTDGNLEWTAEQLMDELGYSRPTMYLTTCLVDFIYFHRQG